MRDVFLAGMLFLLYGGLGMMAYVLWPDIQKAARWMRSLFRRTGAPVVLALVAFGSLFLASCVSQPTKRLVDQTRQAAHLVKETSGEPLTVQVANDMLLNMEEVELALGPPKIQEPYSAEASAGARADSKIDREESGQWFKWIIGLVGLTPWGAAATGAITTIGGIASAVWSLLKEKRTASIAKAFASGVSELPAMFQQLRKDPTVNRIEDVGDKVKAVMADAAEVAGVAKEAEKLIHGLRTSGTIRKLGQPPTSVVTAS